MADQSPPEVLDYLGAHKTLTLATSGGGDPGRRRSLVNDGSEIYLDAPGLEHRSPRGRGAGGLLRDRRVRGGLAPDQGHSGTGPLLGGPGWGIARAADLFGRKYPQLRPGSTTPWSSCASSRTPLSSSTTHVRG